MQEAQLWKLFEKTGNVGVYILYKQLSTAKSTALNGEVQRKDADSSSRNSDKRN